MEHQSPTKGKKPSHASAYLYFFAEDDLKEQVEGSQNMPDTYETVVARAQLALVSFYFILTISNLNL